MHADCQSVFQFYSPTVQQKYLYWILTLNIYGETPTDPSRLCLHNHGSTDLWQASKSKRVGINLKTSTQWDIVGISAALLTFVSFFVFMFCGPLQGVNLLLLGFGNPLLMVFYLLFSFVSFIYGYLHSEKSESGSREDVEIIFINTSRRWRACM